MYGAKSWVSFAKLDSVVRAMTLSAALVVMALVLSGCQLVVDDDGFNVVTGPSGNEATQVVEQVFPAIAVKELRIDNVRGSVRVESWDRSDIGVTITKKVRGLASPRLKDALGDVKIEASLNDGKARLSTRLPDKVPDYVTGYQVDYVLRVPEGDITRPEPASEPAASGAGKTSAAGAGARGNGGAGGPSAAGANDGSSAASGSNGTTGPGTSGSSGAGGASGANSKNGGGASTAGAADVTTKRLTIRTTGGEVRVEAGRAVLDSLKVLDIATSAAEVRVADVSGQVLISTTNGRVYITRSSGDFEVKTTNGEIVLDRVTLKKEANFQTANAPITARIVEAGSGKYTFKSSNAAIELYWPPLAGARFELAGGNVVVSQSMTLARVEQGLSGLRGTLGDGRGQVTAVTPNGSLYLRSSTEVGS